ncbi:MAG: hypothetical protein JW990_07000 [Thermoleophilia bacterium]|nr:hypothetical protein [Thermoleophilia bacterium]
MRKPSWPLAVAALAQLIALVIAGCGSPTTALLDELREVGGAVSFTVYYLGAEYQGAPISDVRTEGDDERLTVGIEYRRPEQGVMLTVQIREYGSWVLEHDKPYVGWELVREMQVDGHRDRVYRGASAADILYYLAQRGSTEVILMGFTDTAGYMTEEQLAEMASSLVPVR